MCNCASSISRRTMFLGALMKGASRSAATSVRAPTQRLCGALTRSNGSSHSACALKPAKSWPGASMMTAKSQPPIRTASTADKGLETWTVTNPSGWVR
ncbi:hypothetical protein D3C71_1241370 [compost metagenome]